MDTTAVSNTTTDRGDEPCTERGRRSPNLHQHFRGKKPAGRPARLRTPSVSPPAQPLTQPQAASTDVTSVLAGVAVVYCAEEMQARRLLAEMLAADWVAIDIETAPNKDGSGTPRRLTADEGGDGGG